MAARVSHKAEEPGRWFRLSLRLVSAIFVLAFAAVVGRAYYLQVVCGEKWQKRADQQYQKVIPLAPQRGTIYDRNRDALAVSLENDSIYVEPQKLTDMAEAARQLAAALHLSSKSLYRKFSAGKGFVWVKRRVTPRESLKVRELKLAGVGFTKEHKRYYPNSEIGAQVVGFTGLDPQGLEGVELSYDSELLGDGGYLVVEQDALGRGMTAGHNVIREGELGHSIYLTLDRNLQYLAEKELAAQVKETGARAGTVVVMEPATGKILAMASQPDYNPNAFWKHKPSQWRNRAICDTYEPGSTFKVFLIAAALEQGVVQPQTQIYCENGKFRVGGRTIHDHHKYKELTVAEILKVSSNIGTAKIGKALERERFHHFIRQFGFGGKTGVDLPGEVPGLVRDPDKWFEVDLAAISFGQGIGVTPLQLVGAVSVIANGGVLMQPYLVERIVDSHGEVVRENRPRELHRVVSRQTAAVVRDMMVSVTEDGGTGTLGTVPGFSVAGKTGTAQKVDPVTGGYSVDKRVSSFVGFVPADAPRLAILVVLDEPQGQTYGGLVAAPVFSRIATQALRYLEVAPGARETADPLPPVMELKNIPLFTSLSERDEAEDGAGRMPDLAGMSYRQVLQVMERTGLNMKLEGSGRVIEQNPRSGAKIRYGAEVRVRFSASS